MQDAATTSPPSAATPPPLFSVPGMAFVPHMPPFLALPGTPVVPWLPWKRYFRTFLEATGGEALQDERKKAILLSNLGFEGQRLYYDLASQTDQTHTTFEDVLRIFDQHYEECTNPLVHRIIFRDRKQLPGETFQDFVTVLQRLAPACVFGAWHDESLRDQILQGVASKRSRPGEAGQHGARPKLREASEDIAGHCYRCGSPHHIASDPGCPAKHVSCHACGKVGHFASVCRSRNRKH
ncbi:uncharacterized protein [Dermacentor andersoni]|uniref:uncharacterized protein n=1 Tax=Dermacentor andersoni TaxID=34620 RepID=UPI003B3A57FF